MPRALRSNRGRSNSASTRCTALVSADWVTPSSSAAAESRPVLATARKYSISRIDKGIPAVYGFPPGQEWVGPVAALRLSASALLQSRHHVCQHPQHRSHRGRQPRLGGDEGGGGGLGWWGGGARGAAPTPNIDALATQGLRLQNFNVESDCVPTRSALMTGRHPIRTGC